MELDQIFHLTWISLSVPVLGFLGLALMVHKVLKKLEHIENRMGDLNLRLAITETRLEERQKNLLQLEKKEDPPKKRGRPRKNKEHVKAK